MRSLNFEKKITEGAYCAFTKKSKYFPRIFQGHFSLNFIAMKSNKNQSISWSNSGVITSQFELANLTKVRKSKKHSSFLVKY